MYELKQSGVPDANGKIGYFVTFSDVILLAAKTGVAINTAIAREWLADPGNRKGIEGAIDTYIMECMKNL
jgi:hypothetical protein